jgi:hypothetical protein
MAKLDTRKGEQEKAILKFCTSTKKNKEIKENIVKRQNTLSELLKDLQTKGLLIRTIEGKYLTTQAGVDFLAENGIIEENSASSIKAKIRVEYPIEMPEKQKESILLNYPVPFAKDEKTKGAIEGFLYLDEGHKDRANMIIEEVLGNQGEMYISGLFHIIGDAVAKAYGIKKDVHRSVWWNSKSLKDRYLELKASLDFNAGISLHFNGRSISDTIPWGQILKSAIQNDVESERLEKRSKNLILKNKEYRRRWLKQVICRHAINSKLFTAQRIITSNPDELENIFIQRIREEKQEFPMTKRFGKSSYQVPKIEEIRDVLEEMKKEGTIKIKQVFAFEIDEKKLYEQEQEILRTFYES